MLVEYIRDMCGARIVEFPRTGEYTRKAIELRHPEEKPAVRERASGFSEEWSVMRCRELDGVDGRLVLLRAAEAAAPGGVQAAFDEVVRRLWREGTSSQSFT